MKTSLLVAPNPSTGIFKVQNLFAGELKIYTIEGKCVFEKRIVPNQAELEIELPRGIYFLRHNSQEKTHTLKIVIR